jgi:hypothetical protein
MILVDMREAISHLQTDIAGGRMADRDSGFPAQWFDCTITRGVFRRMGAGEEDFSARGVSATL